jgi:hypothetical protein
VKDPINAMAVGMRTIISQNTLLRDWTACVRSCSIPSSMTWSPSRTSLWLRSTRRANCAGKRRESSGTGPICVMRVLIDASSRLMAATSERWSSDSAIASRLRMSATKPERLLRYASRNVLSPATAYCLAERSSDVIKGRSERLASVTRTAECTACSESAASFSNAITLVNSAKTSGAATIEKPMSSSDRNDFGYVKRIIAPSL